MRRLVPVLMALVFLASCVSTLSTSTAEEGTGEVAQEKPVQSAYVLDDVPVPFGFKVDKERSFISKAGDYRSGIIYCTGDLSVQDVKEFFLSNLPDYDWEMVNIFEGKEVFVNFTKPGWILNIQIVPKGSSSSEVKIMIGPIGGGKKIE